MKIAFFNSKTGTTLVELMIALLIIAVIILGGGMFFFYGRVHIVREARRRAALLVASQRLEALKAVKAADWDDIALDPPLDPPDQPYYITYSSPDWVKTLSPDKDTEVLVENLSDGEMVTKAQWVDDPDVGDGAYDYLKITVTVNWPRSAVGTVSSTTLIASP